MVNTWLLVSHPILILFFYFRMVMPLLTFYIYKKKISHFKKKKMIRPYTVNLFYFIDIIVAVWSAFLRFETHASVRIGSANYGIIMHDGWVQVRHVS